VATSVQAVGFEREGDRVVGVHAVDTEAGRRMLIRARQVINATATWTDQVQGLAGRGRIRVRASKGIHLVGPNDRIHSDTGLILRTETSVLFVIPWGAHWIVGTTDTDWHLDLAHPAASQRDIDYLLKHVNQVLRTPLTHDDIQGVYAGLRPLLEGESDATSELSREHAVSQTVPGLITVAGGKYTTYRVMAADAVDVAARNLPTRVPPSCSDRVPLWGAAGYQALWNRRERLADEVGLHVSRLEHLLGRYGAQVGDLLDLITNRPELGRLLPGSDTYLAVEVAYAASHEAALHLDDVLTRRTRLSIESFHRGVDSAEAAADLMAQELGWPDDVRRREVEHYRARVQAERNSQAQPDDQGADTARLGAPEVRRVAALAS
jgi:glycerol-3-phosphate dehydrogenase